MFSFPPESSNCYVAELSSVSSFPSTNCMCRIISSCSHCCQRAEDLLYGYQRVHYQHLKVKSAQKPKLLTTAATTNPAERGALEADATHAARTLTATLSAPSYQPHDYSSRSLIQCPSEPTPFISCDSLPQPG